MSAQKHRLGVLTRTYNLCLEQKYKEYQKFLVILVFLYENFQFLEVKFSIYLNRRVFVMKISKLLLWAPSFKKALCRHKSFN